MTEPTRTADVPAHQLRCADRAATLGYGLGRLAHELGTPLNVILGRATMIMADESAGAGAQHHARVILENAQSITRRICAALDAVQQRPLSMTSRRIVEVVEVVVGSLSHSTRMPIEIRGELDVVASFDLDRTVQVLTHLLSDALEIAGADGSVAISIQAVDVEAPADPHCSPGRYASVEIACSKALAFSDDFARDLGRRVSQYVMREQSGFLDGEKSQSVALFLPIR
jgi:signal transduction histidine kinase